MGLCSCACECAGNLFRIITTYIVGLLQLAICTAIICIIAINLSDYEVDVNGTTINYSCMLQPDENGRDVCVYGYVASGVSMGATLFFMLTVCCTCSCYTILGMWLDLVLAVLGVLWWIAAAAVFSAKGSDTTGETDAQQSYRSTIYGLSWTMVALFAVFFLFHLIRVMYTLCHCCACCVDCCGGDSKKEQTDKNKKQRHDEEAGRAPLPLSEAPRPYVAPTHAKPIAG